MLLWKSVVIMVRGSALVAKLQKNYKVKEINNNEKRQNFYW